MAIFIISDLHLDIKTGEKSMEVFGHRWKNYTDRLQQNWRAVVSTGDTVVIPVDISWALTTEEAVDDLRWIASLPGKKLLMKGNHDFWWSTVSKMKRLLKKENIEGIDFLYNNAVEVENVILAGSRGWFTDASMQHVCGDVNYRKIVNRETTRLKLSLDAAKKLQNDSSREIVVFFHFPPLWGEFRCNELLELLCDYRIRRCFFGHIHGCYAQGGSFEWNEIQFRMVSADYLDFLPLLL